MNPRIRLKLSLPIDQAWLTSQAAKRRTPVAQVLVDVANELENKVVDSCRWHQGVLTLGVVHQVRIEGVE